MLKTLSTAFAIFATSCTVFSQVNQNWCGSYDAMEANFKLHPELRARFEASQEESNSNGSIHKTSTISYTIPVVFHILHQNGTENITDAQINDQVAIFNRDFNLQNADTSVVIPSLKGVIGNVHFNFVLAKLDPNGNCTSGIDRFYDPNTASWSGNFSNYVYTWDPTMYLNFYVVKGIGSGAAGYAYYPGSLSTGSNMDAIVILQNYVGSIGTSSPFRSRALTHEVGHWFNLQHVWGNTNNPGVACGDDNVGDTPITKGFTSCPTELSSQVCTAGVPENYQNYMDYAYCSVMFTEGQATRMTAAINSSTSGRSNLWSGFNLMATGISSPSFCAPAANFQSNKQIICIGETINFSDMSNVSTPTNWVWQFPGGTPNTSTLQNPSVTYQTPGNYLVELVSGNSAGNSVPESKTSYITVLPSPTTSFISEGFETSAIPNATWFTRNSLTPNANWEQTSLAAGTGNNSAFISETVSPNTTLELFSPTYNFNAMSGVALTLKWAGAERDASSTANDVFTVMFSTNCGVSWVPRLTRNIKSSTAGVSGVVNGNFIPTPADFKQEIVPLGGLTTATNILFKLKFTTEDGSSNNFFVDDINLSGVTALKESNLSLLNLNVFPSPATENVSITFDLLEDKKVEISLQDVLGKTIKNIAKQNMTYGNHTLMLPLNEVSKGIYFVTIQVNDIIVTEKIIKD